MIDKNAFETRFVAIRGVVFAFFSKFKYNKIKNRNWDRVEWIFSSSLLVMNIDLSIMFSKRKFLQILFLKLTSSSRIRECFFCRGQLKEKVLKKLSISCTVLFSVAANHAVNNTLN